jgi:diadenosine tetraphosphatase ApaH/serine/threonine PP2A family protein phosphatase
MPRQCLDVLLALDLPTTFIVGNGDRECVAARRNQMSAIIPEYFRESMRWNAAQLTAEDERAIDEWPLMHRMSIPGIGEVAFCHATPQNDVDIFTSATPEEPLRPLFDPLGAALIVCGHTHIQFDRMISPTRVVNAGSVGMPFDEPGAYWLLVGPGVELRRTTYDYEDAARRVRQTAYPLAEEFASKNIVAPPSKQSMIEAFARAELR